MSEAISAMQAARRPLKDYPASHFRFEASDDGCVATVRLNRRRGSAGLSSRVAPRCSEAIDDA
jgi:hypothetical protein